MKRRKATTGLFGAGTVYELDLNGYSDAPLNEPPDSVEILQLWGRDETHLELLERTYENVEEMALWALSPETIRTLPSSPSFARVTRLRLIGTHYKDAEREPVAAALVEFFAQLSESKLETLDLRGFLLPHETMAAISRCPALANLRVLCLDECIIEDASPLGYASFTGLRFVRCERGRVGADLGVAIGQRFHELISLNLTNTATDDRAAVAIATAPMHQLRGLALRYTKVGEEGVVALCRAPFASSLDYVEVPDHGLRYDAYLAAKAALDGRTSPLSRYVRLRHIGLPEGDADRIARIRALIPYSATPGDAMARLRENGLWPRERWPRRFVQRSVRFCDVCYGDGWSPEGACANHYDPEVSPLHEGPLPRDVDTTRDIAVCSASFEQAEQLAIQMHEQLALVGFSSPPVSIVWYLRDDGWSRHEPISLDARVRELGETIGVGPLQGDYWAHDGARQLAGRTPDPFTPARAVVDRGYGFHSIGTNERGEVRLTFPVPRRR